MVTTTYLVLVLGIGAVLWLVSRRVRPRPGRLRALLVGVARPGTDLVERMADRLVEQTTVFGTSYAIPGYLGAVLPKGVFEAASAARPQLTAEVLDHYRTTMVERSRRLGRTREFTLPEHYVLRLVLACGAEETVFASFEPIVDVRGALTSGIPAAAAPTAADPPTTARRDATVLPGPAPGVVLLSVDGVPYAQRDIAGRTPVVSVGRGNKAHLRCPDRLSDVSRLHAELTFADGRTWVRDCNSANGTWLLRSNGVCEPLTPGEPFEVDRHDAVWLDEAGQATVTVR